MLIRRHVPLLLILAVALTLRVAYVLSLDAMTPYSAMGGDNRPGGGLGAPIDAPDPLHEHRWMILAGLAVVLIAGGVFVVSRANQQAGTATPTQAVPETLVATPATAPIVKDRSAVLLDALKEELFQLEIEKQQGRISADEYEKSKTALDQTLRRALSRQNS